VVLVSEKVAKTLKKQPACILSGYCNANDAYHQTASSPDGTGSFLAMKGALAKSNLEPWDIDYINLHGTGTQNNDIAEGTAIRLLFETDYPPMSSTKSFTGHTLGASGGIEAVFSVLAIQYGLIYPNLRFETQMKELPFKPATEFKKGEKIPVRIEWTPESGESYLSLKWQEPLSPEEQNSFGFSSEAGKQIDYYFVYGNNMDEVISGYRTITGKASLRCTAVVPFCMLVNTVNLVNIFMKTVIAHFVLHI